MYAVVSDVTPNRATVESIHDDYDDAVVAADEGEMCEILAVSEDTTIGERVWHNGNWAKHPSAVEVAS